MKPKLLAFAFMSPLVFLIIYIGATKMNPEQMKRIVDGAPELAKYWNTRMGCYTKGNIKYSSNIDLDSLRSQLAKREPMNLRAVDIPHSTIVLEE